MTDQERRISEAIDRLRYELEQENDAAMDALLRRALALLESFLPALTAFRDLEE